MLAGICIRNRLVFIFILLFFVLITTPIFVFADGSGMSAALRGTLVINSGSSAPLTYNDDQGFYPSIIRELFKRLDIKVQVRHMQSSSSLKSINDGNDDGIIARVKGLGKKFTNLVLVPEKVIDLEFVVYSNDKNIKIESWDDLKDYDIAYINGWKIYDKKVKSYKSLTKVKTMIQLFRLLQNKRVDLILAQNIVGDYAMKQLDYFPHQHTPYLATREMYMYMHKKNADLVPQLASELKKMKDDGVYKKLYDKELN